MKNIFSAICFISFIFLCGTVGFFEMAEELGRESMGFLEFSVRVVAGMAILVWSGNRCGLFEEE